MLHFNISVLIYKSNTNTSMNHIKSILCPEKMSGHDFCFVFQKKLENANQNMMEKDCVITHI